MKSMSDQVANILRRYQDSKARRSPWVSVWRDLADYVQPIKDHIGTSTQSTPDIGRHSHFDSTAQEANLTYASGCMEWLTPADRPWFQLTPPRYLEDSDNCKKWLSDCTEEMQAEMMASNFYGEVHEGYLDDGAFGTTALYVEEDQGLRFETFECGDFTILEDHRGQVDTIFRELKLTPRQAAAKFGKENLHENMRAFFDNTDKKLDQQFEFIHAIYPREEEYRETGKLDGENMPIASCYIDQTYKHKVKESGMWEMPVACHRHLKWGKSPYGFAPSWNALTNARQVNMLQMNLDVLAEVAAFPRIAAPAKLKGEIDLRAKGVTFVEDMAQAPREFATGGRYDIGKDRVAEKQDAINRAFHVPLFNMFREIPVNREMTATEVTARLNDKLTLFSPTFARKITEYHTPTILRVFSIMLRGGAFAQIPAEMQSLMPNGMINVVDPQVRYSSRLALAMEQLHATGFAATLGTYGQIFEYRPELLDNYDLDVAMRDAARSQGVKENWIMPEAERDEMRQARAEMVEQQQQEQQLMAEAELAVKAQ